jgi:hypothetical protein
MPLSLESIKKRKFALAAVVSATLMAGCGGEGDGEGDDEYNESSTPVISIADKSVKEGDSGENIIEIDLSLSATPSKDVTFKYELASGTAESGTDFKDDSRSITIRSGVRRYAFEVKTLGDTAYEEDEWFEVHIVSAQNAEISTRGSKAKIELQNDDEMPTVYFISAEQLVAETVGSANATLAIDSASGFDTEIDLAVSGTAQRGDDYTLDGPLQVKIPAGELSKTIPLSIIADAIPEGGETVIFKIDQLRNSILPDDRSNLDKDHTLTIAGDVALNDTGVTTFSDGSYSTGIHYEPASAPMQDASVGRDVTDKQPTDGHAGFSFTKLDRNGNPLSPSATDWSCVRDNVTGLVWEEKQETFTPPMAGESSWRAQSYTYTWFQPDETVNGGFVGDENAKHRWDKENPVGITCAYKEQEDRRHDTRCNTETYINDMNLIGVCGFDDWRLPRVDEMRSIYTYQSDTDASIPDPTFFAHTEAEVNNAYLSGTPSADNDASAWCVDSASGDVRLCQKRIKQHIRAVRSEEEDSQ